MEPLLGLLAPCRRLAVLTGAGCSTESGIPDYRTPRDRPRSPPVQYIDFVRKPAVRQRYWARSLVGWPAIAEARPNPGHRALAELAERGRVHGLITQNVDGLHQAAGSPGVIELHGTLAEVRCLDCGALTPRAHLQRRLEAANPRWVAGDPGQRALANADGDAELVENTDDFVVCPCETCGGVLKPRVVFFGESVPPHVVEAAYATVRAADGLLVVGTSLTVLSGLRFVRAAAEQGLPIGCVNLGATRGDDLIHARVEGRVGEVLPRLVAML
jgi:NAD-dependent deacetylase sirtuin 4